MIFELKLVLMDVDGIVAPINSGSAMADSILLLVLKQSFNLLLTFCIIN
ncbi:MAG: hypothetical protein MJ223_02860 [Mycoplasmoidaceae bacterium]|nr:hypothetical protein [Mycoplasmoidaceae bacterium]